MFQGSNFPGLLGERLMRIAYFARIDLGKSSGVLKKILRQLNVWQSFGHEVKLFALTRPVEEYYPGLDKYSFLSIETASYGHLLLKAISAERMIKEWDPDIIFWRYSSYYPLLNSLVLSRFPTVADINSNYDEEYKRIHSRLANLFHLATKNKAFRNVSGFSTLTNELAEWLGEYKKPSIVIGDGIDLENIPKSLPARNESSRLVVFASRNFPWIALDKIIFLAAQCPELYFDVIGLTPGDFSDFQPTENIVFHGFLNKRDYSKLLFQADVAIGTLGLHRIGLEEMAPLKLREYLAYGLPTIIAYRDTDFIEGSPFLFQLPNTEENVARNIDKIKEFVAEWTGKRVPREAIEHLDITKKEQQRLEFFSRILNIRD
jgi:hypothetical protein